MTQAPLQDYVAIITGAGQGIGRGIALALAKKGVRVVAVGRTLEKCQATCDMIAADANIDSLALQCDVSQLDTLSDIVDKTVARFGRIDILINNAVATSIGPLLNQTMEKMQTAFQTGPMATLKLMQLCHPHLKVRGGSIINMASSAAKRWDMSNYGVYAAEKDAIRALTRAAASEWGPDNIRANNILPHAKSPALEKWIKYQPTEAAAFVKSIPLGRIGDCQKDIGEFVALLCCPESSYISGQSIALDGGQAFMG
ncbi:MAG: SDR family oxidoreductase [Porticoccaceae bacterium]|jgi:NAD(P)-dependent dehydrogenase (short-subunit alcohol dehydrogenase family)|nr:SDR family oxidoreductase [Alphaproteobacteria bacterium]MDP4746050.1 SDR family oxidoreductase [Porticoccaceae bacterium]MDP4751835.1 SDR family oxidoreductase [Porticoccaceae bacterium]MDP4889157.1 SDR family oxidoreductase [Porticoccaceae bacterium]|tara:strand:+ start:18376 stop:19143 length:768 start_codon:yes stop_codon:yes gene_type:complete